MEVGHLESLCCDFGMDSVLGQASGEIAIDPLPRRGQFVHIQKQRPCRYVVLLWRCVLVRMLVNWL